MFPGESVNGVIEISLDFTDVFDSALDAGEDDYGQGRQD